MKSIEYEITDIDWLEQDAIIMFTDEHAIQRKIYFQWDAISYPTIFDALDYLVRDSKFYDKSEGVFKS